MKERVTLTLDSNILKKVDSGVNGFKIKNRSHAVELLIMKALGANVPKKAVVLAGGNIMAVGHMKEKIEEHFTDGSRFGIKLSYIEETEPLGTAGPLRLGKNMLTESFIVSNGDELKDINIEEMYQLHKESNALVTIALTTVEDPSKYGVARLSGSKILEFVEKPKKEEAPSKLINSGFYIIEPEVIDLIPKGFTMLEKDIFPKLAKRGRLFGYPFSGQWFDTGNIERYEKALKEWKDIN